MVIDDEPTLRMVLEMSLSDFGHQVLPAENGQAGLEKLKDGYKPDLILVDLKMPILSGKEFVLALRSNPQFNDISVLILSGSMPGFGDYPPKETYQGIVSKPFDLAELCEITSSLCKKSNLNRYSLTQN